MWNVNKFPCDAGSRRSSLSRVSFSKASCSFWDSHLLWVSTSAHLAEGKARQRLVKTDWKPAKQRPREKALLLWPSAMAKGKKLLIHELQQVIQSSSSFILSSRLLSSTLTTSDYVTSIAWNVDTPIFIIK